MEVEKRGRQIVVNLSAKEVFALQDGRTIGDRPGVTIENAKVEVIPLSAIEPTDESLKDQWSINRLELARKAYLKGELLGNGDLRIIVPGIKLSDVRLGIARLPRKFIDAPSDLLEHIIPKKGILLKFGGSLQVVDVPSFFP